MRLGTLSLLAGIDLLTGVAISLVSQTHKSSDFIEFLKILDAKYPDGDKIRLIVDNHSAYTSKETRQMLKGIRVNSKEELLERIYRYFDEINADPLVYHWTYKMDEIDPDEAATI